MNNNIQPSTKKANPTITYLRQALRADLRIDALIQRSQRYMDRATRATSRATATRISGTGSKSNVEDAVIALVDLSKELDAEIIRLSIKVREIEGVIGKVPNERYRDLLRWRYLNGWRWELIAEGLELELRQVFNLHGKALMQVEKIRSALH